VVAEVALIRDVCFWVDIDRVIRACVHARLAADTDVVIEVNDAIARAVKSTCGANFHARGVITMVAPHDRERSARIRERTGLDVLQPSAVHPDRDIVFALASNGACMATDARVAFEYKSKACHWSSRCG